MARKMEKVIWAQRVGFYQYVDDSQLDISLIVKTPNPSFLFLTSKNAKLQMVLEVSNIT